MLRIISKNTEGDKNSDFTYQSVVFVRKVTKTVKGGKNISFYVIVVVGNKKGSVGIGSGKARSISDAIDKGISKAMKNVIKVTKIRNTDYRFCASKIILRNKHNNIIKTPSYISSIFEALGIHNISCKLVGSRNVINNLFCVFNSLKESNKISRMLDLRKNYLNNDN